MFVDSFSKCHSAILLACIVSTVLLSGCSLQGSSYSTSTTSTTKPSADGTAMVTTTTKTEVINGKRTVTEETTTESTKQSSVDLQWDNGTKQTIRFSGESNISMEFNKGDKGNFGIPLAGCENINKSVEFQKLKKSGGRLLVFTKDRITYQIYIMGAIKFEKGKQAIAEKGSEVCVVAVNQQTKAVKKAEFVEKDNALVTADKDGSGWALKILSGINTDTKGTKEKAVALLDPNADFDSVLDGFSSNNAEVLKDLAGREQLSPSQQIKLIEATFSKVSYSSDQADVLCTLLQNKSLTKSARKLIAKDVDKLSYSSDREQVLKAMVSEEE